MAFFQAPGLASMRNGMMKTYWKRSSVDFLPESAISRKYRSHLLIKTLTEIKTVNLHFKLPSKQHRKTIGVKKHITGRGLSCTPLDTADVSVHK
jgi:hypothetical protein